MRFKAVLFDVGGVIIDEEPFNAYWKEAHRQILLEEGIEWSERAFEEALERGLASYCPHLNETILAYLLQYDFIRVQKYMYRQGRSSAFFYEYAAELAAKDGISYDDFLRPGIREVCAELSKDFVLGTCANQPPQGISRFEKWGIREFFSDILMSGDICFGEADSPIEKPDARIFLQACKNLEVHPEECIMIGDRLDNDIFPANKLGIFTIQIPCGWFARQKPRHYPDIPSRVIQSISELPEIISNIEGDRQNE